MNVRELKTILQDAVDELEIFDDNLEIKLQTNTYFVRNARYFLGSRQGYLDLGRISDNIEENDDYESDDFGD